MMLWAPENSKGMFCIEPVTRIPDLSNNYESVADQKYPRLLLANESQKYSVTIEVMLKKFLESLLILQLKKFIKEGLSN